MGCNNLRKVNKSLRALISGPWDQGLGCVMLYINKKPPSNKFYYAQAFLSGVKTSFNIIWPIIYMSWLGIDVYSYLDNAAINPNMSSRDLISGLKNDPAFHTTNKGIEFYGTNSYARECLTSTIPFVFFGILNLIRWKRQIPSNTQQIGQILALGEGNTILQSATSDNNDINPVVVRLMGLNTWDGFTSSDDYFYFPFGKIDSKTLLALKYKFEHKTRLSDSENKCINRFFSANPPIEPLETKSHCLAYLLGISKYDLLDWWLFLFNNELADDYSPGIITELIEPLRPNDNNSPPTSAANNELKTALQKLANDGNNNQLLGKIYLRFLLWRRGDHVSYRDELFFLYVAMQYYFFLQWIKIAYNYVSIPAEYYKEMFNCNKENMQWQLQSLTQKYQCSQCASWDFVALSDNNSTQDCFQGVIQQPFNADQFANYLKVISAHDPISICDLRNLSWTKWTKENLQKVQSSIADIKWINTTFSLAGDGTPLNDAIFTSWCTLLSKLNPVSIKLYNMPLDEDNIHQLQDMSWWGNTTRLELNHCMLDDVSASKLFQKLPTNISWLDISYNQLSEGSIGTLLLENYSKIDHINFANNNIVFSASMLYDLFELTVDSLTLDHNTIGNDNMLAAGVASPPLSLINLSLSHCALDEFSLPLLVRALARAPIRKLSLAFNQLDEMSSAIISKAHLPFLTELNYSGNQGLNPHFGRTGDSNLSWPSLDVLDISSISFTDETLNDLANMLQRSNLSSLTINHAQLLDKDIKILLNNMSNYQALSINYNHLSTDSMNLILQSLSENPQLLSIAGLKNPLENDNRLANINTLDLTDTQVSAALASELIASEKIKMLMLYRTVMPTKFLMGSCSSKSTTSCRPNPGLQMIEFYHPCKRTSWIH